MNYLYGVLAGSIRFLFQRTEREMMSRLNTATKLGTQDSRGNVPIGRNKAGLNYFALKGVRQGDKASLSALPT
jgi:hypothetical protein